MPVMITVPVTFNLRLSAGLRSSLRANQRDRKRHDHVRVTVTRGRHNEPQLSGAQPGLFRVRTAEAVFNSELLSHTQARLG